MWAWGGNSAGELGRGTVTDHEVTPAPVSGLAGVTKISAGCGFSLALRSDGTVWAWGLDNVGQLGNGSRPDSAVPVKITGVSQVTAIAAGWDSAVAIVAGGASVWAWGGNDSGQLGDGTTAGHATPVRVTQIGTVHIAGAAAGFKFAAILGTDGSVWAWGADKNGQLGNAPAFTPATRPVNTIGAGSGITQISAGSWSHGRAEVGRHRAGLGRQHGRRARHRHHDPRHRPGAGHRPDRRHAGGRGGRAGFAVHVPYR